MDEIVCSRLQMVDLNPLGPAHVNIFIQKTYSKYPLLEQWSLQWTTPVWEKMAHCTRIVPSFYSQKPEDMPHLLHHHTVAPCYTHLTNTPSRNEKWSRIWHWIEGGADISLRRLKAGTFPSLKVDTLAHYWSVTTGKAEYQKPMTTGSCTGPQTLVAAK